MRVPQTTMRFTVRGLMVVVAIAAIYSAFGVWFSHVLARGREYRRLALYHANACVPVPPKGTAPAIRDRILATNAHHIRMGFKYAGSATFPIFPVEPDPPEPD